MDATPISGREPKMVIAVSLTPLIGFSRGGIPQEFPPELIEFCCKAIFHFGALI
jgi:hypothetical protein